MSESQKCFLVLPVSVSDSDSDSDDDDLSRPSKRRRKFHSASPQHSGVAGAGKKKNAPKSIDKKKKKRKSSKAPLLEPFNWDDLFPKPEPENEAEFPEISSAATSGGSSSQSDTRRTSRDYLLARTVIDPRSSKKYGVFDRRSGPSTPRRPSYGCYTNLGRRMSNDPEASGQYVDINRNRTRNGDPGCHSDRVMTNRETASVSRRSGSGCQGNRTETTNCVSNNTTRGTGNHGSYEKATHVNLQSHNNCDVINSYVHGNTDLTAALRNCNRVNLPPLNGVVGPSTNNYCLPASHDLSGLILPGNTSQMTSSSSSLASSYQQQCFCDTSLHISLRCRQCQASANHMHNTKSLFASRNEPSRVAFTQPPSNCLLTQSPRNAHSGAQGTLTCLGAV